MSAAVLLINSLGTGGAERAVASAAARLHALGRDVRVVCLERVDSPAQSPGDFPIFYLSNQSGSANPFLKLISLPILAFRLRSYLAGCGASAVMSHLFRANFVNVLSRVLAGSRHAAVLVNHTRISRLREEGIQGRINWALCRILYPRADLVASVSTGASRECARLLGLPADKVITLYDPIETAASCGRGAEVAGAIVAVGRLVGLKRFEDAINAFSAIAADFPQLCLKIVGDGPERGRLEQEAAATGLKDRIYFLGRLPDPREALAGSAAFVSTSGVEGFGMAIVEALSAGIPVISADCPYGPREILSPSTDCMKLLDADADIEVAPYGVLYPVGSVKALEKALRLILRDAALRDELRRKGPGRAAEFSVERSARAYERLLFA